MILPHYLSTIGIDISDYKLRLAALRYGYRKPELRAFGEVELQPGIITTGTIQQPQPLIAALKQLMKHVVGSKLRNHTVRIGLPEQHSFMTTLAFNNATTEEIKKEAIRSIPFQEDEMYYDLYTNDRYQTVTIAAGRKDFIDRYLTVLEAAEYKPIGLYVEAHALTRALCPDHNNGGVMIIDLGLARSTVVFYLEGAVYFTTSYPSVIDAQGLSQTHLQGAVEQMLRYYQDHYAKIDSLQQIILCGSGAHLPNVSEFIKTISQVPTSLGNPLQTLRSVRINKKIPNPLGFSTAIGLALI